MSRKAKGFDEPNYTQTPNRLFDELLKEIDTMAELKVTLAIIRQTAGWHRRRVTFGVGKIERLTGLARNSVISGAEAAEARGTIRRLNTEGEASWELVINDTPANLEGVDNEPPSGGEDTPPQGLTENPSTVEGLKRKKEILNKELKDSLISILQSVGYSVFGNNMQNWHNFKRRLERDDVTLTGDKKKIVISGLSEMYDQQFTLAQVWQDLYAPSFSRCGLEVEFTG